MAQSCREDVFRINEFLGSLDSRHKHTAIVVMIYVFQGLLRCHLQRMIAFLEDNAIIPLATECVLDIMGQTKTSFVSFSWSIHRPMFTSSPFGGLKDWRIVFYIFGTFAAKGTRGESRLPMKQGFMMLHDWRCFEPLTVPYQKLKDIFRSWWNRYGLLYMIYSAYH